jgi:outer membrane protein
MRRMRKMMSLLVVCAGLISTSASATASFAPRELGLGVGSFALLPHGADQVSWGLPITLEAGYYVDSGFDLYLRVPLMLLQQVSGTTILATGGQFGLRYLFMEESIRPYVMLHLAGIYFFRDAATQGPNFYAGPGTGVGVDFFVADSISLGIRGTADLFLTLNAKVNVLFALGGGINVTTYF